jgi:hypothetical protein
MMLETLTASTGALEPLDRGELILVAELSRTAASTKDLGCPECF